MRKHIDKFVEIEILKSISPSEVLKYLNEKEKSIPYSRFGVSWDEELDEELVKILYDRNERLVDIGLAMLADQETVEKILNRNTKENVTDSSVLIAALSNRMIPSYICPKFIEKRIDSLVERGSPEELRALLLNPNLSDEVINDALLKKNSFSEIDFDRYVLILHLLLSNPRITIEPEGDFDGNFKDIWEEPDMTQSSIISNCWNLLLSLPVNAKSALLLSSFIDKFKDVSLPYKKGELDFVNEVIDRWNDTSLSKKEEKGYSKLYDGSSGYIKFNTIKKLGYDLEKLKDYLLEKNDFHVTAGYFSGFAVSGITKEKFDEYHKKYGEAFLWGIIHNEKVFLKNNFEIYNIVTKGIPIDFKYDDNLDPSLLRSLSIFHNSLLRGKESHRYISLEPEENDYDRKKYRISKDNDDYEIDKNIETIETDIFYNNREFNPSDPKSVFNQVKSLTRYTQLLANKNILSDSIKENKIENLAKKLSKIEGEMLKGSTFIFWLVIAFIVFMAAK